VVNAVPVNIVLGEFQNVLIWAPPPECEPGTYDLFVDINANKILDNGDGINNAKPSDAPPPPWGGAGLCVEPCKEVGGATLSRRQYWLVPGAAAVVALVLGGAVAGLAWRRRRG
jgi:hypothetical protein